MRIADVPPAAPPEWLLTYGDLMTLLLTIFVMLVSMGELKQTDKFQGVADSLHEQFGRGDSQFGLAAGELRPRNSMLAAAAVAFRTQRNAAMGDDLPSEIATVANQPERLIRPADRTTIGTAIYFSDETAELSEQNQAELRRSSALLSGKPHPIEVRGHAAPPIDAAALGTDPWELAYRRARATMQFLVDDLKIDETRIRIATAVANEPLGPGHELRVEVFLLEDVAGHLAARPSAQK
jgi:chemotaxis protein MotB